MASSSLKFLSLDPSSTTAETILIIHGAFSSHAGFIPVARLLVAKGYHILLPDLPAHGSGSSGEIQPFRMNTSVSLLAELIAQHAHSGRAYVVGFSLGASIALALAAEHHDLVGRVYCSGTGRDWDWSPFKVRVASWVIYTMSNAPAIAGEWFNKKHKLVEPPELIEDDALWHHKRTLGLHRDVLDGLVESSRGDALDHVRQPVLLVAASAHDPVDAQKVMAERLTRGGCEEVKTVELKGWPHAWNLRDPDLFADSVDAWFRSQPLPKKFVEIP